MGARSSYSVGACRMMPAEPTTTASVKIHRNRRSKTIATYFQSSFTWKRQTVECARSRRKRGVSASKSAYPGRLLLLPRLFGDVVDAVDGLVQLRAAVPAAQRIAQSARVVQAAHGRRAGGRRRRGLRQFALAARPTAVHCARQARRLVPAQRLAGHQTRAAKRERSYVGRPFDEGDAGVRAESRSYSQTTLVRVGAVVGATHDQKPRQHVNKDAAYPRRHCVRLRRPKVYVQHHHCHADAAKCTLDKSASFPPPATVSALLAHLNVSSIIVKSTNFPSSGTTSEVGGIISANSKKNTVSDSRIEIDSDTCANNQFHRARRVRNMHYAMSARRARK